MNKTLQFISGCCTIALGMCAGTPAAMANPAAPLIWSAPATPIWSSTALQTVVAEPTVQVHPGQLLGWLEAILVLACVFLAARGVWRLLRRAAPFRLPFRRLARRRSGSPARRQAMPRYLRAPRPLNLGDVFLAMMGRRSAGYRRVDDSHFYLN